MIVVDASVVIDLLLSAPNTAPIERRLLASGETLHAPHLVDMEVIHTLRRLVARGDVGEDRGEAAVADLADFPLRRYPHDLLLERIWELRHSLSAYDASYVAVAEALNAPLMTRDRRLAAAHGHDATIEVV